ncbi:hypothetical protein DFH28DRAFT_1134900 [Melampsora americana]|nr:hypothetical protein DFH28DRAFT_1134900 [Melampsora americana]
MRWLNKSAERRISSWPSPSLLNTGLASVTDSPLVGYTTDAFGLSADGQGRPAADRQPLQRGRRSVGRPHERPPAGACWARLQTGWSAPAGQLDCGFRRPARFLARATLYTTDAFGLAADGQGRPAAHAHTRGPGAMWRHSFGLFNQTTNSSNQTTNHSTQDQQSNPQQDERPALYLNQSSSIIQIDQIPGLYYLPSLIDEETESNLLNQISSLLNSFHHPPNQLLYFSNPLKDSLNSHSFLNWPQFLIDLIQSIPKLLFERKSNQTHSNLNFENDINRPIEKKNEPIVLKPKSSDRFKNKSNGQENKLKEDMLRMKMKRTNKREFVEDVNGSV